MAAEFFSFSVKGVDQVAKNLADLGAPKIMGKMLSNSLRAGAAFPLAAARANARNLGLGEMGFTQRGNGRGRYRVYGRIPRSLKINRMYMPGDSIKGTVYRMNILARGQRLPGLYMNKAPHAHLIEWGWKHTASGRHIAGRPFMGPAIDRTAAQVVEGFAKRLQGQVDALRFPGAQP